MIAHIFIKNFKAFKRETIALGNHTLFIGTHNSGKTTILEALDCFFNHNINRAHIRNKEQDIVIECLINNTRYRKVFSPPHYVLNNTLCIGNFQDIHHLHYLYFPNKVLPLDAIINKLLETIYPKNNTDITLTLPGVKSRRLMHQKTTKTFAYEFENSIKQKNIKPYINTLFKQFNLKNVLLGIDYIEAMIPYNDTLAFIDRCEQTIITTKQKRVVDLFPYDIQPLYKTTMKKEMQTITDTVSKNTKKTFLLVEGKYDVPWFEKALRLLTKEHRYRVIPCGGYGNIKFVQTQLKKSRFKTLTITDGDVKTKGYALKRDIIELYADIDIINKAFNTKFDKMPTSKHTLFNAITRKDDIVKQVLAGWAINNLTKEHPFTQEVEAILNKFESSI